MQIGTVISYCTNDYRFIDRCIEEARKFSQRIVVPVCDHFFNGSAENRNLLEKTYAKHPDCLFVEFPYRADKLYSQYHLIGPEEKDWAIYWAATTRYIGFHYLDNDCSHVLFLDSDEIVEGEEFLRWSRADMREDAMRLASYYYALRPNLRGKRVVNLPLWVKRDTLAPLTLLNGLERIGAYLTHPGPKREKVVGLHGKPMVHHYSWVRTKEECLHKARTWGHRHDEDWPTLIEETFQGRRLFNLEEEFETVEEVFFDPFKPVRNPDILEIKNVLKISERELFWKELEYISTPTLI